MHISKTFYGGVMEKVEILGVKVSKVDYESAMEIIEGFLTDGKKHYVVTPNPEFIVLARKDSEFRQILNQADLAIPDGVGLRVGTRVTGTDLMIRLCGLAAKKGYSVFLLGGRGGVAKEAAKRLEKQFANLNIAGTYEGNPREEFDEDIYRKLEAVELEAGSLKMDARKEAGNWKLDNSSLKPLASSPASTLQHLASKSLASSQASSLKPPASSIDLLFVAYGAPKQEKWIAKNLPKIPVKVAMGVGGAFDFIAGKRKRAPKLLRRLGLEWLWRLIQEPQRFPRIFNATIKFPLLVFFHKLKKSPGGDRG